MAAGPNAQVGRAELEADIEALVPQADRSAFWLNSAAVQQFVLEAYVTRQLAAQAREQGLAQDLAEGPEIQQRSELVRRLLAEKAKDKLPDAQGQERYARSEYLARPERFTTPEQIRARHILLRVQRNKSDEQEVQAQAQKLLEQLAAGADFATLAQEASQDPGSAARGGELDWFDKTKMAHPFSEAAFALAQPGDRSALVRTGFGWHIIELLERKPATVLPFEEAKLILVQELQQHIESQERQALWNAASEGVQLNHDEIKKMLAAHGNEVLTPGGALTSP